MVDFQTNSTTGNILVLDNRAGMAGFLRGDGLLFIEVGGLEIDAGGQGRAYVLSQL